MGKSVDGPLLIHTYGFHVMADWRYYLMLNPDGVQHGSALSINLAYRRNKDGRGGCCLLGFQDGIELDQPSARAPFGRGWIV